MKKLTIGSPEWRALLFDVVIGNCPQLVVCKECGRPIVKDFVCRWCGCDDPCDGEDQDIDPADFLEV